MAYQYTYLQSNNYTPGQYVPGAFGYARVVNWITIHHWGNLGQSFDTVANYLRFNGTPTSAHYVVEDGRVAQLVQDWDAAWHSGNALGNAQSIGIECRPEATPGDYQTVAELIRNIRSVYGDVPLVPHNYWFNTSCPGAWDLGLLDSIARGLTPTGPPLEWDEMASQQEISNIVAGHTNNLLAALNSSIGGQVAALSGAVASLADSVRVLSDSVRTTPFYKEITWANKNGIMKGFPDGTFRPNAPATRGAMAVFLYRMPPRTFVTPSVARFSDVPVGHPFFREVEWLAAVGVSTGYSDGTFRPDAPVERAPMAAFFARLDPTFPSYVAPSTPAFSDVPVGHPFFREVSWLSSRGYSTGYSDGTFHPSEPATRGAVAAIIYRVLGSPEYDPPAVSPFVDVRGV